MNINESIDAPFFVSKNFNALANLLVGNLSDLKIETIFDLCVLSEGLVLGGKVLMPRSNYYIASCWGELFDLNINQLFIDPDDVLDKTLLPLVNDAKLKWEAEKKKFFKINFEIADNYALLLKRQHLLQNGITEPLHSDLFVSDFAQSLSMNLIANLNIDGAFGNDDIYAYRELVKQHKISIERIEGVTGINTTYLPPIFSLILERASSLEDIPKQIASVKNEFSDLGNLYASYRTEINEAETLKEQLEIIESHMHSEIELGKKLTAMSQKSSTSQVRYFLDVVKPLSATGILKKFSGEVFDMAESTLSLKRVNRYVDIYEKILNSRPVKKNIQRLFGDIDTNV